MGTQYPVAEMTWSQSERTGRQRAMGGPKTERTRDGAKTGARFDGAGGLMRQRERRTQERR